MIKIARFLYIHWLCIPLFVFAFIFGFINTLLISYCIVFVHELSHLLCAVLFNVRSSSIIIMPFGMTLRLSDSVIKSPKKEILIALAGPFSNIAMAALAALFSKHFGFRESISFFIFINIVLALTNLLPANPLDGGRILRAFLVTQIGFIGAASITKKVTLFTSVFLFLCGILVLIFTKINASLLIISLFIALSMISDKKNNEHIIMKNLLINGEKIKPKAIFKAKLLSADKNAICGDILRKLDYSSYHLVGVIDENKHIKKILTETEIVNSVLDKKSSLTLDEI